MPNSDSVRVRFAPSPTGYLHVGGARTALFNWLFARHNHGKFILRIEDTDAARNTPEALAAIFDGLNWLGLDWDEGPGVGGDFGPYLQSERQSLYEAHLEILREKGLVYDEPNGAVRFRFKRDPIEIDDQICGPTLFTARDEPDMTIRRPDGSFIFHFVVVVDDMTMNISHVIRGEDHLSNTWKHIELFNAFGAKPPVFAHIPLILNPSGSKMSKRDVGASIASYQEDGFLPEAVANYLALLGWSPKDDREKFSLPELVERFKLPDINGSNARFDMKKCLWFNAEYLRTLSPDAFLAACAPSLAAAGLVSDDTGWLTEVVASVQTKVERLSEVPGWIDFFFTESVTREEGALPDPEAAKPLFLKLSDAFKALPLWTTEAIDAAVAQVAADAGGKPGKLMPLLRVGLSGRKRGPDLHAIMHLLGQDRCVTRLAEAASL